MNAEVDTWPDAEVVQRNLIACQCMAQEEMELALDAHLFPDAHDIRADAHLSKAQHWTDSVGFWTKKLNATLPYELQQAAKWREMAERNEHPGRSFCLTQSELWERKGGAK
jgi:hypothetical protein